MGKITNKALEKLGFKHKKNAELTQFWDVDMSYYEYIIEEEDSIKIFVDGSCNYKKGRLSTIEQVKKIKKKYGQINSIKS